MQRKRQRPARHRALKETGIDAATALLQAGITLAVPTGEGALAAAGAAAVINDMVKRFLSPREESRVEELLRLAGAKMAEIKKAGAGQRADVSADELAELLEGTLLVAKDTYEQKKLPLIANLLALTPFINTPIPDLVGTLHLAQQLTYRQLCVLSVIWPYGATTGPSLTTRPLNELFGKTGVAQGVIHDLVFLVERQLVLTVRDGTYYTGVGIAEIIPAQLRLMYPGMLLVNGMMLASIPTEDREAILRVLGSDGFDQGKPS